jgi:hypothetical protein
LYAARALLAHQAGRQEQANSDLDEVIRRGADEVGTIARVAEVATSSGDWKRAAALAFPRGVGTFLDGLAASLGRTVG